MKKRYKTNRRKFIKAAGTIIGFPAIIPSHILSKSGPGPNDRITLGIIGTGKKGMRHVKDLLKHQKAGRVQLAAVCDVAEKQLKRAVKIARSGVTPYADYRYILERKDIDGVVIATPDHWHAVQMVHSAESKKHVYVEKPACCTIEEGKAMVSSARKNNVSVQVGSQGRSHPEAYIIHRYIANGMLGQIKKVRCFHPSGPTDESSLSNSDIPAGFDWDMWLGPLRWRPYNSRYCPGTFRWFMESGGGQIRDRGAHVMSCALWWLGADGTGPVSIEAKGTVPEKGLWNTTITMEVSYKFKDPDWELIWTNDSSKIIPAKLRRGAPKRYQNLDFGAVYYGTKDKMTHWGGDGRVLAEEKVFKWQPLQNAKNVYKSPGHYENWLNSIKTGEKPIMDIESGVGVANLCILGNLSFILGRKLKWDRKKQEITGDEQARRMMSRPQRHPYHL